MKSEMKWVRSNDGWLAGVCQGFSDSFGIETWIFRCLWFVSFFWFGTGLLIYLLLALCLPRRDKLDQALQRRVLGVCSMLAVRYDLEVGLVRFMAVLLAMSSFGFAIILYIGLYFFVPRETHTIPSAKASSRV